MIDDTDLDDAIDPEDEDAEDHELPVDDEASYICGSCGEEIVVTVDPSAGAAQEYVEDCPVCCRPHVIHVQVAPDGEVDLRAELE